MHNKTVLIFSSTILILAVSFMNPCFSLGIEDLDSFLYSKPEKTISLDFTNAKLNDVLKILSQQSGLNFIAATDIASKSINLYLENVSVEEALKRILSANNLTYEINPGSNIFVVNELKASVEQIMTRVYPLKFATVPSSKLNTTLSIGSEEETKGSEEKDKSGIIGAVKSILTPNGSVIEDTRTNSLIISDIPNQFPLIERTIAKLDVRIPQVLIEAEMLDISKSTADLLGAKFGSTPMTFTGAQRDTLIPFDRNKAMKNSSKTGGQGFTFDDPEYRVGTLSFQGLALTLQFLRTQTDTKNLARPRILTLNNDTAEISIRTDEAIGLASVETSVDGVGSSVNEAERVQTGIFLIVTPQANVHTREITMAIEPKVIQAKTGATFSGQTFKDPEQRGSKSILRVNDGDTIVLGGLLRTSVDEVKTRVPILAKIPVLGAGFRHKDSSQTQRELIIFITPHIITENTIPNIASHNMRRVREQSVSTNRNQAVEKELSYIEEQKFSSYK